MTTVVVESNETLDSALRRFNHKVMQEGILSEARRRQTYEPPSARRKRKAAACRKRARAREQ